MQLGFLHSIIVGCQQKEICGYESSMFFSAVRPCLDKTGGIFTQGSEMKWATVPPAVE